jgi:hypothetical protein
VRILVDTHRSMREIIAALPSTILNKRLQGSNVTYFDLVSGIASHDIYHAGQIQLLKRLMANA